MKFNKTYFLLSLFLFIIEFGIERFLKTGFIRAYIGDLLVVVLIYCLIKSFFNTPYLKTAIGVLLFSYLIEFSQYINILKLLNIPRSRTTDIILGSTFSWYDMVCYTLGIGIVLLLEFEIQKSQKQKGLSLIRKTF